MVHDYRLARERMVKSQLSSRGIDDKNILRIMSKIHRHLFIEEALEGEAYNDHPLPIGHRQTISQPYIVGLIVPDPEWTVEWCRAQDMKCDFASLNDNPQFRSAVRAAVDRVNADLSVTEKVRQFEFTDEPFTIENGEMTPSMKIRRHVIRERYADRLKGMYKD